MRARHLALVLISILALGVLLAGCSSAGNPSTGGSTVQTVTSAPDEAGSAAPPGSSGEAGAEVYPAEAAYVQSAGTQAEDGQTYVADQDGQSAILVTDGGALTVTNATIQSSGETSSQDSSSFYGLNAAVVATSGSRINLSASTITTTGTGANGAFATGAGSSLTLSNVIIEAAGKAGHGVMATQGGTVTLYNVNITTAGADSAPLATDRGGGTITANGGSGLASGEDSPAMYSTGTINVNGGTYEATGSEAAVVEGSNRIVLNDVNLLSSVPDKWGVMIYRRVAADARGAGSTFTMTGGSLKYAGKSGPLFFVTNSTGIIVLEDVEVTTASGVLVQATAGDWGASWSNGGVVQLMADRQSLTGDLVADSVSSITVSLGRFSTLTGSIDSGRTAKETNLVLDSTSIWNVTEDSYLTSLTLPEEITGTAIANIVGSGHTVYYDATDPRNGFLAGETFDLTGGGTLRPLT